MIEYKNLYNYIIKVFSKWFIYISILPGLIGVIVFYFGFESILLSWQVSIYIFIIALFIATYFVWNEEKKEKIKLEEKLKEYENKKPKLRLTFENKKEKVLLENKIFERKLEESQMWVRPIPQHILQRMANNLLGFNKNPIIDEFHESFIPLNFELHNEGDFKATNIRVDIYFPEDFILINELPQQNNFLSAIISSSKRSFGLSFQEKNHLRLLCDKSLHPDYIEFDEIYISANKKAKFKIKYKIFCEELDSKGFKGELTIETNPIKEIRTYTIKDEFERDKREYEEMLKHQVEETLS